MALYLNPVYGNAWKPLFARNNKSFNSVMENYRRRYSKLNPKSQAARNLVEEFQRKYESWSEKVGEERRRMVSGARSNKTFIVKAGVSVPTTPPRRKRNTENLRKIAMKRAAELAHKKMKESHAENRKKLQAALKRKRNAIEQQMNAVTQNAARNKKRIHNNTNQRIRELNNNRKKRIATINSVSGPKIASFQAQLNALMNQIRNLNTGNN